MIAYGAEQSSADDELDLSDNALSCRSLPKVVSESLATIVPLLNNIENRLKITGKGGIIFVPALPLNSLHVTVDGKSTSAITIPAPIETSRGKIQPARGIEVTELGEVILTAYRTDDAGERLPEIKRNCNRT